MAEPRGAYPARPCVKSIPLLRLWSSGAFRSSGGAWASASTPRVLQAALLATLPTSGESAAGPLPQGPSVQGPSLGSPHPAGEAPISFQRWSGRPGHGAFPTRKPCAPELVWMAVSVLPGDSHCPRGLPCSGMLSLPRCVALGPKPW